MGYESLKAVLLRDKFDVFLRLAGDIFPKTTIRDAHTGCVLTGKSTVSDMAKSEATRQVFSVNHSMLRSLLLSDLEEGVEIKYDMAFKRFHVLPNGVVEVHFDNGRFTHGTMLVGADGTASRVRQQYLSRHVKVLDTDCGVVYGKTPLTTDLRLLGLASDTTTVVTSQPSRTTRIIDPQSTSSVDLGTREARERPRCLRDQNDCANWVLLARLDKFSDWGVSAVETMTSQEVADVAMELTASWVPQMQTIVDLQASEWASLMRISTMAPKMRVWTPSVVTLIGDAVHKMPPAGFGSNSTIQDARELCTSFREFGVTVEAVEKYEKSTRARAKTEIEMSFQLGHELYDLPELESMDTITS